MAMPSDLVRIAIPDLLSKVSNGSALITFNEHSFTFLPSKTSRLCPPFPLAVLWRFLFWQIKKCHPDTASDMP